jgi:hypothetical protein
LGTWEIDLAKGAIVQEKAMEDAARISEQANDLATIIDRYGLGKRRAREIDCSENAIVQEKPRRPRSTWNQGDRSR